MKEGRGDKAKTSFVFFVFASQESSAIKNILKNQMSPKRDKKKQFWAESLDWQLIVFEVMVGWMERLRPATYPQKDQKQRIHKFSHSKLHGHSFIHWATKPQCVKQRIHKFSHSKLHGHSFIHWAAKPQRVSSYISGVISGRGFLLYPTKTYGHLHNIHPL